MNTQPTVLVSVSKTGVATLTLNRAEKSNAFDPDMITALLTALEQLKTRDNIRCLILNANGKHFSSGADLNWMKSMALKKEAENKQDAAQLAALLERLYRFPAPTIAVVQGAAFGGALGLICCCDITIASPQAKFCLSEAKLGLVPATIAPYVCRAMGVRQAQRYMLTTELITATTAQTLGIIHFICDDLALQTQHIINSLLNNSPNALHTIKQLCQQCENNPIDQTLINYTSDLIAHIRCTPEAQEGIQAFFEQSQPSWSIRHDDKDH